MARMVNLGQVGFGLVADTQALKDSLEVLKTFGREVDRLSKLTSEASQKQHAWGVTLEGTITRMQTAAQRAVRNLQQLGASQDAINKVQNDSAKVIKELTDNWESLEGQKNRVMRATVGQQEMINRVMQQERVAAQTRLQVERDHERAILENQRREQQDYATRARFVQQYESERRRQSQETQRVLNQNAAMTNQANTLITRAQVFGISGAPVTNVQSALGSFTSASDATSRATALRTLRTEMSNLNREIIRANGTANVFSTALRDLERAAILAVGPLSGIGARLAVLSALFESTNFTVAATIGAIVGIGTAATLVAANTIKATMEMQRFDALLTASTGSAALVAGEYTRVVDVANKWGFSVRELVEPYAKFTTAARLSGLALEDQTNLFEAVTVASRATNLSTERTSLVFLALEQMLSKGTVNMEEMRRQLGDLLPGAFQLAAQAMGMTQAQFTKALTEGQILATDLLPRLSKVLMDVFGPAAEKAAQNLQAEFGRFRTATFELWNAFERGTGITQAFANIVRSATDALNFMATHVREMIGLVGALAGGGGMLLLISNFTRLQVALTATVATFRAFISLTREAGLAALTLIPGMGSIGGLLLRIGAAAVGAFAGYQLLKPAQQNVTDAMQESLPVLEQTIDMYQRLGEISKQTFDQLYRNAVLNIKTANSQIDEATSQLQARITKRIADINEMLARPETFRFMNPEQARKAQEELKRRADEIIGNDPVVKALQENITQLEQQSARYNAVLDDLMGLKQTDFRNDKAASTGFENWVERVQKDLRKVQTLDAEIKATGGGEDAIRLAKARGEALDLLAQMPKKGQSEGDLEQLLLQMKEMGFTFEGQVPLTDALTQAFTKFFLVIERKKDELKDYNQMLSNQKEANRSIANSWEDAINKNNAARDAASNNTKEQEKVSGAVNNLRQQYEKLFGISIHIPEIQDFVNQKLREFGALLQDTSDIERYNKYLEDLHRRLDRLDNTIGDRLQRATEKAADNFDLLAEAVGAGVMTLDEAQKRLDIINADMYKAAIGRATIFGRDISSIMRQVDDVFTNGIVDGALNVDAAWEKVLDNLGRYILEFAAKAAIVQPIMTALFGGAFTGKNEDMGTGIFEKFLVSGATAGLNAFTAEDLSTAAMFTPGAGQELTNLFMQDAISSGAAGSMGFADGGGFEVGGSGGPDSKYVGMRLSPGEVVNVRKGGQKEGNVTVIINNQSGVPMEAETSKPQFNGEEMVMQMWLRRMSRDSASRQAAQRILSNRTS